MPGLLCAPAFAAVAENPLVAKPLVLQLTMAPPPAPAPATDCVADTWLHLADALAWPVVVGLLLWGLRGQLATIAGLLATRISKFSMFSVAVELTPAKEPTARAPLLDDIRDPTRQAFVGDSSAALVTQIGSSERADYCPIYLGSGDEWLTSRLYLAMVGMARMRGVKAFVFLEQSAEGDRRFVAIADVEYLRWVFAQRWPWLEVAYVKAYREVLPQDPGQWLPNFILSDTGAMESYTAQALAQNFIQSLKRSPPSPTPDREWIVLGPNEEERAEWVTAALLRELLPPEAFLAKVRASDDQPRSKRARAVLRRSSPFVALVDERDQFQSLIDRAAYLDVLAASLGEEPE